MIRIATTLIISLFATVGVEGVMAQTCRIRTGVSSEGCRNFKEVYEYDYVSQKPSFPGGETRFVSYINEMRHYPAEAYNKGIEGRVLCSFVVNVDGSISNIRVVKGVEESLNAEAVRIFSNMPQWQPGKIEGTPVPVRVFYPVPFRR